MKLSIDDWGVTDVGAGLRFVGGADASRLGAAGRRALAVPPDHGCLASGFSGAGGRGGLLGGDGAFSCAALVGARTMSLLPEWKSVLSRAWSVKFMVLAALLSGVEVVMQILEPSVSATMPKGLFAALAGLTTAGALVARVLAQNEADDANPKP